jgi:thiamine-monophosphate kinase
VATTEDSLKIGDLGEFGWIAKIAGAFGRSGDGVELGIGDDAALLDAGGDLSLVATCDCQVEGVHFRPEWIGPLQIGRRAAAVNLSDLAAMGARPRWALASLTASSETEVERLDGIFEGLVRELERAGGALVGGNTARAEEGLVLDLFLLGQVEQGRAMLRSGVRSGDAICVTGDLGAARAGLLALERPDLVCDPGARERVVTRHLAPRALVREGRALSGSGLVTACIDVSDGLLADAGHLTERSGLEIRLDAGLVPVSSDTAEVARAAGLDPVELALAGGEDFELLFAVAEAHVERVVELLREECGTPVRRIGTAVAGDPEVVAERDGERVVVEGGGFDHFGNGRDGPNGRNGQGNGGRD